MPGERRRCRATRTDAELCFAPCNVVDPATGFGSSYDPEKLEKLQATARKGGQATAEKVARASGLEEHELPGLHSPQDTALFLEAVVRAVTTGRVGHHEAKAAARGVREWLRAHKAGQVSEPLDRLTSALAEWRRTGDPEPLLELVEGASRRAWRLLSSSYEPDSGESPGRQTRRRAVLLTHRVREGS